MVAVDRLRAEDWYVADVELSKAREMVRTFHYAKGSSRTAVFSHGLFRREDNFLCGCALWLPPTKVACQSVNKEQWKRVLSLTRLVVLPGTPKNACSFLLSRSMKLMKKDGRFISFVSYADESQGHSGLVYKACNWTYVGRTAPTPRWVDPATGRQVAVKSTVSRTKKQMEELGYVLQGKYSKHKYVYHF